MQSSPPFGAPLPLYPSAIPLLLDAPPDDQLIKADGAHVVAPGPESLAPALRLRTDESQSASITGQLLNENGEDVLYYIYRTEPKALRRHANPSQYGGARLVVESRNIIDGQYWTSEKTLGDLSFERIDHHAH